ncbi:hypothetical protein FSP39_007971 [Pinctada imbricata]|uniref:Uncharacterized protein n=1 Tax=Pinctada imbricata TaxID=66713 RepID=A0AA88YFZ0_PINIB|nr:hypothetical protein FSP39_007971 [Pinctada imbricata]
MIDEEEEQQSLMQEVVSKVRRLYQRLLICNLQDQMKTKNFYIGSAFLVATTVSLWLLSNPTPNFNTIMTQTHKQISNIKNIPENLRNSNTEDLKVDPMILERLGFHGISSVAFTPQKDTTKIVVKNRPVIATVALPGQYRRLMGLIKSAHFHLPDKTILIYNVGLDSGNTEKVKKHCNKTALCVVKKFEFDKYPSHLKDLDTRSFRPIVIQETLNDYGSVIWAEPSEYFIHGHVTQLLKQAQKVGIVGWTIKDPVSSITYDKMFKFFKVNVEEYYFLESVKTSHLILYNTEKLHKDVMLPWVRCALIENCISPVGCQNSVCDYNRKPLYIYAGCHKYDMSALNVILGKVFDYMHDSYKASEQLFGILDSEKFNVTTPKVSTRTRLNEIKI